MLAWEPAMLPRRGFLRKTRTREDLFAMPLVQVAGLATLCEEAALLLASFAEPHADHLNHETEAKATAETSRRSCIMGNRAVITTTKKDLAIYLHWNGGRDTVEPLLKYCELQGYRPPSVDCYGWRASPR